MHNCYESSKRRTLEQPSWEIDPPEIMIAEDHTAELSRCPKIVAVRTWRYVLYSMSFSVPRCRRPMCGSACRTVCYHSAGVTQQYQVQPAKTRRTVCRPPYALLSLHAPLCVLIQKGNCEQSELHTHLPLQFEHQSKHAVGGRVLWAKVDGQVGDFAVGDELWQCNRRGHSNSM